MAIRLLKEWRTNQEGNKRGQRRPFTHTAVDDLESFLWVLVWVLVHHSHPKLSESAFDPFAPQDEQRTGLWELVDRWKGFLQSPDVTTQMIKLSMFKELHDLEADPDILKILDSVGFVSAFRVLLWNWHSIAVKNQTAVEKMNKDQLTLGFQRDCYNEYLNEGFAALKDLRCDWDPVINPAS
jgi:hypothetical protein